MIETEIIGLVAAGLAWSLARRAHAAWQEAPRQRLGSRLARSRRFSVRDFPEGACGHVVGVVGDLGEPLTAPLSGRACAACTIHISRLERRGSARPLISLADAVPFTVADDTETASVIGPEQIVALHRDHRERVTWPFTASARVEALLAEHGHEVHGGASLRCAEGVLLPGDRVVIIGRGSRIADEEGGAVGGYRRSADRLVLASPPGDALAIGHASPRRVSTSRGRFPFFDWPE